MAGTRPLSRDALRGLIAHKDYWNPGTPEYAERQKQVREGFAALYPAKGDAAQDAEPDRTPEVVDPIVREMQQRYETISDEYETLLKGYVPQVPEYDATGRLVKDYVPVPDEILERRRQLGAEMERLEKLLAPFGALPGLQIRLKK